jgi:hypothetical protein
MNVLLNLEVKKIMQIVLITLFYIRNQKECIKTIGFNFFVWIKIAYIYV